MLRLLITSLSDPSIFFNIAQVSNECAAICRDIKFEKNGSICERWKITQWN